ncbi:molybdopterin-dependent oxidoreductase [Dethiosulfatarculus sandiegensis]|uniref:Formate dehydrogenase subunit alpha n=1 Tax=Dethiosulfatarculus sandiegensis TaxID=1429043 RepID=A0A0D2J6T2_9BACT|nr:molybdopterin-dependent oxidoreductase [Dethiosulfatarculus sandiegensis]KIX13884.1 hypothetical protein X474_11715 [Dethiosulfatarculus sandiegensis]
MQAVTLTLNGQTISARAGSTILEVARIHGIYIPTLCHADFLRPIGACRICQVEDKKRGVVVPACVTKITDNMEIETDSERVKRNRLNILRLLMASHPESCLVCEKGNTCELRALAAKLGLGDHGLDRMPYHPRTEDRGPFMARDLSKCIMCAKCLRADQDLVVEGVIDYNKRGFDAHPATLFSLPLDAAACTFCGTCLEVCPTGAIYEKGKPLINHSAETAESICPFCACGCGLSLSHNHQTVISVKAGLRKNGPASHTLCVRGRFGLDHLNSPQRLATPLLRYKNGFEPISWDQAIQTMQQKFGDLAKEHGPDCLGFLGGVKSTNEENYLLQKLARIAFGTNNLDSSSALYWTPFAQTILKATGFAAGAITLADLEKTSLIMLIGTDLTQEAPLAGYAVKRAVKKGARLIVLDPLRHQLTSRADFFLNPQPGGELNLLLALIKTLLDQDLINHEFVDSKTKGLTEMIQELEKIKFPAEPESNGVEPELIEQAAKALSRAESACLVFGKRLMSLPDSVALAGAVVNLALITGNLGREGAGILPVLSDANSQGSLDMGLSPKLLPGHRPVDDSQAQAQLKRLWGKEPPNQAGLDYDAMIKAADQGDLKGLFLLAENPVETLPAGDDVAKALDKLEFLVACDMFLTKSARQATLVLPLRGPAETGGTMTSLERRVKAFAPAIPSPGDFPPLWQVLTRLAASLGHDWGYKSVDEIMAEIQRAAPLYHDLSTRDLEDRSSIWPVPGNELVADTLPHGIGLPDGQAVFQPMHQVHKPQPVIKGYPYTLFVGLDLPHFGQGVRTGHSPRMIKAQSTAFAGMAPKDYERLELTPEDQILIRSPQGSLKLPVRPDPRLDKGMVFISAAAPAAQVNHLFEANSSPARLPCYCRVSLRKV